MAAISGINDSSQLTPSGTVSGVGTGGAGQDMFFKLLITQLQNQDPLNPMDSTDFTAQLAQFSQLEKLDSMNSSLGYLQLYLASLNNAQAVDFIGKDIVANGNAVELTDSGSADLTYRLADDAQDLTIDIFDQDGRLVRTLTPGARTAGDRSEAWDGNDSTGEHLAAGIYTFEVSASGADGETVETSTFLTGSVSSVTFEDGVTYLVVGNRRVAVGDVTEVIDGDAAAPAQAPSGSEKTMEIVKGVGSFVKNVAPLAMMFM